MSLRLFDRAALRAFRLLVTRAVVGAIAYAWLASDNQSAAQLCAQLSGVNFSQNFNTLATSGSNNTSVPSEFKFVEAGTSGNLTYAANDGNSMAGDTYSYGSTGSSDRALGELTTSTVQSTIGACFVNNTNHAFTSFIVGYTGEEWRLGVADGTLDRLDFQYSTGATSLSSGTYLNVDDLDFTTKENSAAGAKDGNAAANRTVFAPLAITPAAPIQPEQTFYIRWLPSNISGANDGLAIDDFSIGTTLAPGVAGDYNSNGIVDAGDYVAWRKRLNQAATIPNDITPGTVTAQDYTEWINRFGKTTFDFGAGSSTSIPEPAGLAFILGMCAVIPARKWRKAARDSAPIMV